MRKYEIWIAFVLALILMFLASCKSKQVTINEQVDSVSVSTFSLADIRSQMLDFSFDSMEIVVADSPMNVANVANVARCHNRFSVKIKGGRMRAESSESRAERSEKRDSVKVKSEYHEEKTIGSQKGIGRWWFVVIAGGVLVILIILSRYSKLFI